MAASAATASATSLLRPAALRSITSNLSPHRYAQHYNRVLAPDLLYMTYDHALAKAATSSSSSSSSRSEPKLPKNWDPLNPYAKNRPSKRPRGNKPVTPGTKPVSDDNLVRLDSIVLNTFVREASASKSQLLGAIAGFQAMTGEALPGFAGEGASSSSSSSGIQVVRTGKGSASFKVRSGQVCGVKVELKGEAMWSFLETLVDLVLPRMKDWHGVKLPPPSVNRHSPSSTGGVVAFGLPPSAMALFPGVEVNLEQYPRLHGFNIQFLTNARGLGAQDQARALLSGFRIPFVAA